MEKMKLTFVNVGYGEAMVLECPDANCAGGTFVMVIDGGSGEAAEYADSSTGRIPLADYLDGRGLDHVDVLVSTHIHEDHICGLVPVAEKWPPRALWQTLPTDFYHQMRSLEIQRNATSSERKFLRALNDYQTLCGLVEGKGGALRALRAGEDFSPCPGLRVRVLAPADAQRAALERACRALYQETDPEAFRRQLDRLDGQMNNFSLMLHLDFHGTKLLLPGDTNRDGYGHLSPAELKAHLFKVGHHGQRDGAGPDLLQAIAPAAVVCCASSDHRYNSGDPAVLDMMAAQGAALYFSDCPRPDLPPHRALVFDLGEGGDLTAKYTMD